MADNVASQDLRNRALEALERRCAAAKAELLQQQKKISSTKESNSGGKADLTDSSSVVVAGNTSGYLIPLPHVEENDPIYFTLSAAVNENLLATNMDVSSNRGVVSKICHELRNGGYVKRSRELKVDSWIILDNFVPKRPGMIGSRMRALRNYSKRSKRRMSMKQHKNCGTFDLHSDFHKFEIFLPMHDMWKSYMTKRLRHVGQDALAQNLLTADLHGSIILVVECKIPAFTGISGIMIRETAETFGIVTKDDKFRVVPKKSSVFIFQWDCWKITLLGDKLSSRISGQP
ncbi:ribonuclease P protein subunit p29 isoform X3 [Momordica charantia]|uniref:Ribonuclease P protein subunit p29 isoform X3 n=1 Tax=Momordica charantia TaxID=3673 RepID=A0A6J1BR06_MOMCH|nr:ribonuclease P protein subunit p29 isoform X3 [Momordica charantia]